MRAELAAVSAAIPPPPQKGIMEKRILELALETLEQRKALLQVEIASIQDELKGKTKAAPAAAAAVPAPRRKGRMSAALRKAQSERMKKYWELRRQKAAKAKAIKKTSPAKAKAKGKRAGKKAEKQKESKVPF